MQDTHDFTSSASVLSDEPASGARPYFRRRWSAVPWVRVLAVALLILILAGGAYLRFVGLDWDEDQHVHPDERFLTMVLSSLERPDGLDAFFDTAASRYNPHNTGWGFFVYGTLPIFIIRLVAEQVDMTTYGEVYLVGRALSGASDLLTVLLLFFIARRLYDTRVALVAAALNGASVLHIQQSHFMTVDTFATTFATLAFLFAVKVAQEGKAHQYILLGLAIGMALASRINLVLLGPLAVVAAALHVRRSLASLTDDEERRRAVERAVLYLGVAGFVSLLAFRVFQPYAFQGPGLLDVRPNPQWLNNMREISAQASGEVDMPPNHQWANRPAYLFPLSHMVLWGLGLPLGIAGWLGWLLAAWQIVRRRHRAREGAHHVLPVFWVLIVFGYQGQQFTKTMRYFLPIYPTLAMLAAFLLVWLWDNRSRMTASRLWKWRNADQRARTEFRSSVGTVVAVAAGLLVVGGTYAWGFAFSRIYTRSESRIAASYWIYDNIPSAATLHYETAGGAGQTQIPVYLESDVYGAGGVVAEPGGAPYRTSFVPEADGRLGTITFLRLEDVGDDPQTELLEVSLSDDPTGREPVGTRQVQLQLEQHHEPLVIDLAGVPIAIDRRYYVFLRPLAGGAVRVAAQDLAQAGRNVPQATGSVAFQTDAGPQVQALRLSYVFQTSRTPVQYGNFLFGAPPQFIADLDESEIPVGLRQVFEEHGSPLTDQASVSVLNRGRRWRLRDPGIQDVLTLAAESGQLSVYAGHTVGQKVSGFTLNEPATVQSVVLNYLIDPAGDPDAETFEVVIASDPSGQQVLTRGRVTAHMEQTDHPRGEAYAIELPAAELEADREYFLITRAVEGAPVEAWSSILATEHWDMPPPLRVEGKDGFGMYLGFEMENYNDDNPEEFERLLDWLDQTDYIILATNRLYGSIPRLPMRYPVTTEYYRLLFKGELGFELAKEVTSYPSLGPIEIPDQSAEEAFTVYDHPRVLIYRKADDFSRTRVRAMLADEAEGPFIHVKPIEVSNAPAPDLALPDRQWIRQQAAGTWSAIFNVNGPLNRFAPLATVAWLLAVEIVGLAVFPIAFAVFSRFADRGFILSKALGLLLLAWLVWFASSLTSVPYTRWSIALCLLILAAISTALAYSRRQALRSFWNANRRLILIGEGLFLAAFLAFLLVRLGNPDLWHPARGGEKPMDFAYLNAVIKSRSFPPYDPWFAGGYINYYYFGFVIVGTLIKLLGIVPDEAYNLAVPTLFALTFVGAFAVVYNLTNSSGFGWSREQAGDRTGTAHGDGRETDPGSRLAATPLGLGILGGLFVAVFGNLEQVQVLLTGLKNVAASDLQSTIPGLATVVGALQGLLRVVLSDRRLGIPNDWWFWNASRVMPNGEINEFPYFTFVYADLHAHMIALPVTLLALAMAVQVVRSAVRPQTLEALGISLSGPPRRWIARVDWSELGQLALWGLIVGALRAINTWDYPTYLLLAAGALALRAVWRRGRIDPHAVLAAGWRFAVVVVLSFLFFLPYVQNYATAYTSAELWHGARTALGDYITIHGFFLFILGTFLVIEATDWWRRQGRPLWFRGNGAGTLLQYGTLFGAFVLAALIILRMWVPVLGLLLAVPAAVLALRDDVSPRRRIIGILFLLGLALTLAVEFIVLKGDIGRMNTVFKFYIQVWVLWGVAAAASLVWLIPRIGHWARNRRQIWWGAFALLFAAVALYPVLATPAKIRDRFDPSLGAGLDGTAFMDTAVFHDEGRALELKYDQEAIRWMQMNIPGTPVVLEAQTPEYRWGSRVAIYTGLPTVLGWRWHQQQQRSILRGGVVDHRVEDVRTLYDTSDPAVARELLEQYDVGYIYVGQLERAYYAPPGIAKFELMAANGALTRVYENPAVDIYRVEGVSPQARRSTPDHRLPAAIVFEHEPLSTDQQTSQPTHKPTDQRPHQFVAFQSASDLPAEEMEPDLLLDRPVDELPIIADRGWNGLANASPLLSVGVWWLVLALIGLAAWPIVAVALPGFIDRGVALARAVGLIVVGYLVWIASSARWVRHTPWTAYAMLLTVGLFSFFVFWRRRRALVGFIRRAWLLILVEEIVFTGAFLLFVGIRLLNPDLWHPWFGGEKPMEFAFLNAIQKSAYFPPYDPYFAGGYINYYYYGLFLVGVVVKLTGIVPEVAFNLAVPTLFALTAANGFSLAVNLVERIRMEPYGDRGRPWRTARSGNIQSVSVIRWRSVVIALAAVVFIGVIGNLDGMRQLMEQLQRTGNISSFDFWRSSRVIPFTINEFPYFSFLFADLHPHMINIPISILTLALLWSVFSNQYSVIRGRHPAGGRQWAVVNEQPAGQYDETADMPTSVDASSTTHVRRPRPLGYRLSSATQPILLGLLLVLALGAVFVINTWELPAYLGLALAAFVLPALRRGSVARFAAGVVGFGIIAAAAYAAYYPFFAHYTALYVGLGTVAEGSPLKPFLTVWGFFLFLLATYVAVSGIGSEGARWLATAWRRRQRLGRFRRLAGILGADATWRLWLASLAVLGAVVLGVVLALIGEPVLALLAPLTVTAGALLLRQRASAGQQFTALLAFVGLGVVTGTEVVFLRDFLDGGEWYRMNTVFKFTTEAWLLLALASAVAVPVIWHRLRTLPVVHAAWTMVFAALLLASLVYPIYGTVSRTDNRFPGARPAVGTLDGMAFMREGEYRWPDENMIELDYTYLALQWLLENVTGTPVVAEANLGYYREGGLRVATYTGLPALLGFHQSEQRYEAQVRPRAMMVDSLFHTTSTDQALEVIRELDISYIYVGQLERAWYPEPALIKFRALEQRGVLETAYENPKVTIYRVVVVTRDQPTLS